MNVRHPAAHNQKARVLKQTRDAAPMLTLFTPIGAGAQLVEEQAQQGLFARKLQ
jgi:hypothetical protein